MSSVIFFFLDCFLLDHFVFPCQSIWRTICHKISVWCHVSSIWLDVSTFITHLTTLVYLSKTACPVFVCGLLLDIHSWPLFLEAYDCLPLDGYVWKNDRFFYFLPSFCSPKKKILNSKAVYCIILTRTIIKNLKTKEMLNKGWHSRL